MNWLISIAVEASTITSVAAQPKVISGKRSMKRPIISRHEASTTIAPMIRPTLLLLLEPIEFEPSAQTIGGEPARRVSLEAERFADRLAEQGIAKSVEDER